MIDHILKWTKGILFSFKVLDIKGGITELSKPSFSKTLVLV